MKRKVEVKFANTPQRSGDTAVFHISDNHLGTTKAVYGYVVGHCK